MIYDINKERMKRKKISANTDQRNADVPAGPQLALAKKGRKL
jgi:hypothetical protein